MRKIYIACPPNIATGGPELLHQLCHQLNLLGYSAFMYYYGKYDGNPTHERYKVYNTTYVNAIEDNSENILIVPEVNINLLSNYKNIKNVIWWLSVDNYIIPRKSKRYKLKTIFGLLEYKFKNKDIIHLSQSYYAIDFLENMGVKKDNIYYLSDYLNNTFINKSIKSQNDKKENIVLYNPKKGYEFTRKIIEKNANIKWVKLENLTPDEMSDLMLKSKVYIDFGNHPGKDRIPREAAISGCCVITGKKGSAAFYKDVPIEPEFKFEDKEENINNIIMKIEEIFSNYSKEICKFEKYKNVILSEESKFKKDIEIIFREI